MNPWRAGRKWVTDSRPRRPGCRNGRLAGTTRTFWLPGRDRKLYPRRTYVAIPAALCRRCRLRTLTRAEWAARLAEAEAAQAEPWTRTKAGAQALTSAFASGQGAVVVGRPRVAQDRLPLVRRILGLVCCYSAGTWRRMLSYWCCGTRTRSCAGTPARSRSGDTATDPRGGFPACGHRAAEVTVRPGVYPARQPPDAPGRRYPRTPRASGLCSRPATSLSTSASGSQISSSCFATADTLPRRSTPSSKPLAPGYRLPQFRLRL